MALLNASRYRGASICSVVTCVTRPRECVIRYNRVGFSHHFFDYASHKKESLVFPTSIVETFASNGAMNPSELAYHRPNKFLLSCIGLWPHQTTMEKRFFFIVSIFFVLTQGFFQIGGMIMAWCDLDIFLESIPPVSIDLVCYIKLLNFIYNGEKMKKILLMIENDWKLYGVGEELKMLRNYGMDCRKQVLMYAGGVYGSMVPFMLGPLVPIVMGLFSSETVLATNETIIRPLMFHVEYLVDVEKWYYYLLIHEYFGTMFYITIVVAIDTILLTYVLHACSLLAIIGHRLQHLVEGDELEVDMYPPMNEDKAYRNIIVCISRHRLVIEYVQLIESAYSTSLFLQLFINCFCLSFTGFQAVSKLDQPEVSVRYAAFLVAQTFPLFFVNYPSQCLLTESMGILNCFTSSSWYLTSIRTRKLVNLMILRCTRPCYLTAANFYVLDMQLFSTVMQSSMSYLTMLCSFR